MTIMATIPLCLGYGLILVIAHMIVTAWRTPKLPPTIPLLKGGTWFWTRWLAHLGELRNGKSLLAEGYFKYNRNGQPFGSPSFNFQPDIILPLGWVPWVDQQPESVLSAREGQLYFLTKYVFSHPRLHEDTLAGTIARTGMVVRLQNLQYQAWDELVTALQDEWGMADKWHAVNLCESVWTTVARVANRAFVGLPLCRDQGFLAAIKAYVNSFATQGVLIRFLCPELQKPVLGAILAIPVHWRFQTLFRKFLLPHAINIGECAAAPEKEVDTFSHWLSRAAKGHANPSERTPKAVAGRIGSAEFGPLHTSTFAMVNTMLDILTSSDSKGVMHALRTEAELVIPSDEPRNWSRMMHLQLHLADSTLRESQRMSRTSGKAILRRVVAANGVVLPDGSHVPYGMYVGFSAEGVHQDPDIYERPEEFRPFRFAPTNGAPHSADRHDTSQATACHGQKLVSTGAEYLSFGHGKHGCPGRFFVAQVLTVMLALMAKHYDIQPLEKKPPGHCVSDHYKPPEDVMIQVWRRR